MAETPAARVCALSPLLEAYEQERRAVLLTGRSLADLDVDPDDGKIRPLREILRRELRRRYGMVVLTYSLAEGLDWDRTGISDPKEQRLIEGALGAHGLLDVPRDANELAKVVTGVWQMSRAPLAGLRWSDGSPMRFTFHFLFGEHLAPCDAGGGGQTQNQLVTIELAVQMGESLALRSSGCFVLFSARDGHIDSSVTGALHHVHLAQPDTASKERFVQVLMGLYPDMNLSAELTPQAIAHLTRNTPNASVERVLRASRKSATAVLPASFGAERAAAVATLSDGTLTVLGTDGTGDLELGGRNIQVPMRVMSVLSSALRRGERAMPRAMVFVGPPGTAKTVGARRIAKEAGVAAFQMENPKHPHVGRTEQNVAEQQRLLSEWTPNVAFVDELTESLPMQRSDFNGDSGATNSVAAALLTAFADESLRGRSLMIGTTNCPWRIGAAQRSRLEFLPFLFPLQEDFPAIMAAIVRNFGRGIELDPANEMVREAGVSFYQKGAGPRDLAQSLNRALLHRGGLGPAEIFWAANDYCGASDLDSVIYADLWAVAVTSSRSYLPWNDDPQSYPFPPHLREIVDPQTGDIDRRALNEAIERLRPHANV